MDEGVEPLSDGAASLVSSAALGGAIVGMLTFGALADLVGRRLIFIVTLSCVIIGSFGSALCFTGSSFGIYAQLACWRTLIGLGIGGEYAVAASVSSEASEPSTRGRSISAVFAMQGVGNLAAALVGVILLHSGLSHDATWRIALFLGGVPGLLTVYWRVQMKESKAFQKANAPLGSAMTGSGTAVAPRSPSGLFAAPDRRWTGLSMTDMAGKVAGEGREADEGREAGGGGGGGGDENLSRNSLTIMIGDDGIGSVASAASCAAPSSVISGSGSGYGTGGPRAQQSPIKRNFSGASLGGDLPRSLSGGGLIGSVAPATYDRGGSREAASLLAAEDENTNLNNFDDGADSPSPGVALANPQAKLSLEVTRTRWEMVWDYRYVLLGTGGSWFIFDVVFYANGLFAAGILQAAGIGGDDLKQVALGNLIIASIALPGYIAAVFTIELIGRRTMQLQGFVAICVLFAVIGMALGKLETSLHGLFVTLYGATFFFSNFGPNTTTYVLPAESFPTVIRATCHGISAASGKLGAVIGGAGLEPLLHAFGRDEEKLKKGLALVLYVCAGLALLGAGWTYIFTVDHTG